MLIILGRGELCWRWLGTYVVCMSTQAARRIRSQPIPHIPMEAEGFPLTFQQARPWVSPVFRRPRSACGRGRAAPAGGQFPHGRRCPFHSPISALARGEAVLTTSMKSVGEVMAIGRSFKESLQKALRSLGIGFTGLDEMDEW